MRHSNRVQKLESRLGGNLSDVPEYIICEFAHSVEPEVSDAAWVVWINGPSFHRLPNEIEKAFFKRAGVGDRHE